MNKQFAKSILEAVGGLLLNLSSGWFGIILISPGFLGKSSSESIVTLLVNIPFGILSLLLSIVIFYKVKTYGYK